MVDSGAIAANLAAVRARIATAAERARRDPATVRLVAVSKTFPAEAVVAAYAAGQVEFGENRVQEAADKVGAVAEAGVRPVWHLIGHLQTNKVRPALQLFDIIQSVDTLRLAEALSARAVAGLDIFLEVNVAGEAAKSGFALDDVGAAISAVQQMPHLHVRGLMTVAPQVVDPEDVRPVFHGLASLARRFDLPGLSMGMSSDFEVAVAEGATVVRVGTAIFGRR